MIVGADGKSNKTFMGADGQSNMGTHIVIKSHTQTNYLSCDNGLSGMTS